METRLYLDSLMALNWIVGTDKLWKVFIENHVTEIRKKLPIQNWNYVSTHDNPADIPTRPSKFSDLKENDKWFHGPHWLHSGKKDWPAQPEELKCNTECFEEL